MLACRHLPVLLPAIRAALVAAALGSTAAACSSVSSGVPFDVGSMAYPQPLPQGNFGATRVTGRQSPDMANMAYPAQLPAGVIARTPMSSQGYAAGTTAFFDPLLQGISPVAAAK